MKLNLIKDELFSKYFETITLLKEKFEALKDAEISTESFSFYTSVSSVFSSKIEEEYMELDSYIKHKKFGINFQPNYTKKIDNLYNAYIFAQSNKLTIKNIKKAHKLLSKNIVETHKQGQFRTQNMYVTTDDGRIEYVAASPFELRDEMNKWGQDLDVLISQEMNYEEVFYYAAFLHLTFVKIHPWNDGNGRSVRLIEKWFIAQKLGEKAWFLQSEKNYYKHHALYYQNIRLLGLEYANLDYSKALPFLLILPNSL